MPLRISKTPTRYLRYPTGPKKLSPPEMYGDRPKNQVHQLYGIPYIFGGLSFFSTLVHGDRSENRPPTEFQNGRSTAFLMPFSISKTPPHYLSHIDQKPIYRVFSPALHPTPVRHVRHLHTPQWGSYTEDPIAPIPVFRFSVLILDHFPQKKYSIPPPWRGVDHILLPQKYRNSGLKFYFPLC